MRRVETGNSLKRKRIEPRRVEFPVPENKTKATQASVSAFLDAIEDPSRKADAKAVIKMMQSASGEKPKMWGPSIIGFGSVHYKYESGREGDTPVIAFSPRKEATVLYSLTGSKDTPALLDKLGKHTTGKAGKGCLYVKKLEDVDRGVLETLIQEAVALKRGKH